MRTLDQRGAHALRVPDDNIRNAFIGGAASVAAYGIVIWAMQSAAIGAVSVLRETSVLFAAVIGWTFLKERITRWHLVSCAVIAAGAVCIKS